MKQKFALAIVAAISLLAAAASAADNRFPYQGRLEKDGVALNGAHDFRFGLFNVATGGSELWAETKAGIPVTAGAFTTMLGASTAIPDAVLNSQNLFVQVSVRRAGGPSFVALTGRQQLLNVPKARGAWEPIYSGVAGIGPYTPLSVPVSLANYSTIKVFLTGHLNSNPVNGQVSLFMHFNNRATSNLRQTTPVPTFNGPGGIGMVLFTRPNPSNPLEGDFACEHTVFSRAGNDRVFAKGSCLFDNGATMVVTENNATEAGDGELNTLVFDTAGSYANEMTSTRVTVWGVKQ